jgi:hypothetical protein
MERLSDTMPVQALTQGPAILTLSRADELASKPLGQVLSTCRNIEAEETAEQYLGNIGFLSRGNTFEVICTTM